MSLKDCMIKNGFSEAEIDNLSGGGELTEKQFAEQMAKAQAGLKDKVRDAKIQMLAIDGMMKHVTTHKSGVGNGILSLLAFDKRGEFAGRLSVESMGDQYARVAFREMSDAMEKLMPKTKNGWQVDETLRLNMVKEIFGESTGDAEAKAFAKSFVDANENLRLIHNSLGGKIGKNNQWHLPQTHNGLKIRKVKKEQWVDELLKPGVLDLQGMKNKHTGEAFTSHEELRPFLNNMYDSIVTNGNSKMDFEVAQFKDVKAAPGIQSRERFLRFKSGESYLNYQKKYGEDNVYSAMITHIKSLANDTALIKQGGTNPQAAFNYVIGKARASNPSPQQKRLIGRAENTLKELTGQEAGVNETFQKWMEGFRAVNVFKLGSASVSAIGDQGTMAATAAINGLPAMKNAATFLKSLAGGGAAERQFLLQSGVNADYVIDAASGMARYGEPDALSAWGKFSKMPDRFLRLTGLNKMTEVGRSSIQLSALGHLANVENLKFKDLNAGNLRMLKESGINEADWAVMAASKKQDIRGAKYLDMRELPMELQMKVGNMMDVLAYRAIPSPDAEVRAIMRQDTKAGTIPGELMKSGGQFKSFGISILLYQAEFAGGQLGKAKGAAYLASTFVTLSMFGMMAMQIKQVIAGKEPMNMDDPNTWLAGMMQGGGLGIFADFIFKDQSRFGASMVGTLAGPSASSAEFFLKNLMLAPTQQAFLAIIKGDPKAFEGIARKYGVDATKLAKDNLPTQLWYTKLLFDRYVFQQISQLSDPKYINKLHKQEARLKRDEGRGFLFQPIKL